MARVTVEDCIDEVEISSNSSHPEPQGADDAEARGSRRPPMIKIQSSPCARKTTSLAPDDVEEDFIQILAKTLEVDEPAAEAVPAFSSAPGGVTADAFGVWD